MSNLVEKIQSSADNMRKLAVEYEELLAHVPAVERCTRRLARFVKMRETLLLTKQICLRVKVLKLADIGPVLEQIEEDLGVEFDKTQDFAEQRWRVFECKTKPWVRVDAELAADGEECRRVVVGYDTVPRYELKCGEEAKTPDAPPPGAL